MLVKTLVAALGVVSSANALIARGACNADNCLRALRATQLPSRSLEASAACTSALHTTVTPETITATQTDFETATVTIASTTIITYAPVLRPRDEFVLPEFATACSGFERFSSACSCLGVFESTITLDAPVTSTTVTVTDATTTVAETTVTPISFRIRRYTGASLNQYITLDTDGNAVYAGVGAPSAYFYLDTSNGRLWKGNLLAKGYYSYAFPAQQFQFKPESAPGQPYFCTVGAANVLSCTLGGNSLWRAYGVFGWDGVSYITHGNVNEVKNQIEGLKAIF
ncbi:hypothetical protein ABW19_dt0208072 [Dactylella cylindrospora]|nr:hypothetical protein ABW19_dt0208072 [Dactylella cylindrospora]